MKYNIVGIDSKGFSVIYDNYMKKDFPEKELRSLNEFEQAIEDQVIYAYALVSNQDILGYATVVRIQNSRIMLLDYYAVNAQKRGLGLGSYFIQELFNLVSAEAFILEVQNPKKSTREDYDTALSRVHFYENNGAYHTNIEWTSFDNHYIIMVMSPENKLENIDFKSYMHAFYCLLMPESIVDKHTHASLNIEQ